MEMELSPKLPMRVYGDGGSYFAWCPKELRMLRQGNIGAAKLALEKHGFVLPSYSNSSKVAYVLQGSTPISFLHPDLVSAYEYIFIWDEDLGVDHFNAGKYIELVKKHGFEISQPGLEPNNGLTWEMTKRRGYREVNKDTKEKPGWCKDPHLPPPWPEAILLGFARV